MRAENLTIRQTAEKLGLSVHTVRSWVAKRRIEYVRLGRAIRIPRHAVTRLVQQGTVRAAAKAEQAEVA
jgi:excisionase family DNA binding protein